PSETRAPSAARCRAAASPIPLLAPVMTTTLPAIEPFMTPFYSLEAWARRQPASRSPRERYAADRCHSVEIARSLAEIVIGEALDEINRPQAVDVPEEIRDFEKGRLEPVVLGGLTVESPGHSGKSDPMFLAAAAHITA